MIIKTDTNLSDFNFWSGGEDRALLLTANELDDIGACLEDVYPDGLTDVELNDLFWFDFEAMCSLIGLDDGEVYER